MVYFKVGVFDEGFDGVFRCNGGQCECQKHCQWRLISRGQTGDDSQKPYFEWEDMVMDGYATGTVHAQEIDYAVEDVLHRVEGLL